MMIKKNEFRKIGKIFQEDINIVKQLKKNFFQLTNEQPFTPWRKMIAIRTLRKT